MQGNNYPTEPAVNIINIIQRKLRNIFLSILLLALLVVLAEIGGDFVLGRVLVSLAPVTVTPTPSSLPPTAFSVTAIALKSAQELPLAQPVPIPVAELPLTISGTYTSQGSGHVWVIIEDASNQYYLQFTPVQFAVGGVGKWRVANVNTNVGTTQIDFVSVTELGHNIYSYMAQARAGEASSHLPDGSQIIQTISIHVTS